MQKYLLNNAEMIAVLESIASSEASPSALINKAFFKASKSTASFSELEEYEALRERFATAKIKAPDGTRYSLLSLQRDYLRYTLVERYVRFPHTWEKAYALTSEYIAPAKKVSPETIRDTHARIKKLLTKSGMDRFLSGLEYEFQIAMKLNDMPKPGTYVEPDYLRENND